MSEPDEKPREWWINIFTNVVFIERLDGPSGTALRMDRDIVHVIEYSAYQSLVVQFDDLRAKLEVAREALIFCYAQAMQGTNTRSIEVSQVARDALKKLEEIK